MQVPEETHLDGILCKISQHQRFAPFARSARYQGENRRRSLQFGIGITITNSYAVEYTPQTMKLYLYETKNNPNLHAQCEFEFFF